MSQSDTVLTDPERNIYLKFIEWQKKSWYGVPGSEKLLDIIAAKYTPAEAEFLTGIPFSPKSLDVLSGLKGMDPAMLGVRMDELTRKGFLYKFERDGVPHYMLNDIFMLMRTTGWPGRTDEPSRRFAILSDDNFPTFMQPWETVKEKGLRVLPINTTIEDKQAILPYEEVKKHLDSYTYFSVSHCPCRVKKSLVTGVPDRYPLEVCLHFDRLGRYVVENGFGREITREETEHILRQCAEAGLIHAMSNQQESPDTICNCCSCCCMWFEAVKRMKHSGGLVPSNYHIQVSQHTCTGCGLCVKRCPMEALSLKESPDARGRKTTVREKDGRIRELTNKTGKVSEVSADLCIGCGVCAYKCQSGSLTLVRNEADHHPPRTMRDWAVEFITTRKAA
ncbi:MAG: 4Fe-4S dicluster domain-containing protein [Dehalococcoidia bacterium]